jgi:hypothetical protein
VGARDKREGVEARDRREGVEARDRREQVKARDRRERVEARDRRERMEAPPKSQKPSNEERQTARRLQTLQASRWSARASLKSCQKGDLASGRFAPAFRLILQ